MNGFGVEIWHRKNIFDCLSVVGINMFAKKDGRLIKVRCLARGSAEDLEDGVNVVSFSSVCLATDEQIISKHERMNLRAARAKRNTLDVVCVNAILKANGEFIESKDKKVRRQRAPLSDSALGKDSSS